MPTKYLLHLYFHSATGAGAFQAPVLAYSRSDTAPAGVETWCGSLLTAEVLLPATRLQSALFFLQTMEGGKAAAQKPLRACTAGSSHRPDQLLSKTLRYSSL